MSVLSPLILINVLCAHNSSEYSHKLDLISSVAFCSSAALCFDVILCSTVRGSAQHYTTDLLICSISILSGYYSFTEYHSWVIISACFILHGLFRCISSLAQGNFALSEAFVLTSLFSLYGIDFLHNYMSDYGIADIDGVDQRVYLMSQATVIGILGFGIIAYPVMSLIRQFYSTQLYKWRYYLLTLIFYLAFSVVILKLYLYLCIKFETRFTTVGSNPIAFGLYLIFNETANIAIIGWWITCLVIMLTGTKHLINLGPGGLEMRRKWFHFIAVIMFIPGTILTPHLMTLSFALAFAAFIMLEYIRIFRIWIPQIDPVQIDKFMLQFIEQPVVMPMKSPQDCNQKPRVESVKVRLRRLSSADLINLIHMRSWDSGPMILSHLYLLIGCSLPLFITMYIPNLTSGNQNARVLASTAGIVALGIGDTFAALVGKRYGRLKWSKLSNKSIEGSIGCFLSIFVSTSALIIVTPGCECSFTTMAHIIITSAITALMEGCSSQNDNLLLSIAASSSYLILYRI
ncbi:hypothetical protein MIR68_002150 [Amoeboaphelidium protococcarum]|nr:hypothetical protein MIR68_002150 [Amoeboaphelidium protococcarum]